MNEKKIPLLVVEGPTAVGKTRLAVELALRYGGEVVSADSMQIYRGMDIGTAKPSAAEMRNVAHHMINVVDPWENYSVADYVAAAKCSIAEIRGRGRLPILAGGTGLYIRSLTRNLVFTQTKRDDALREKLREEARRDGGEALLSRLSIVDPEAAASLHPNDIGRIIRALEVNATASMTMRQLRERSMSEPSPYDCRTIGLSCADRSVLYERINRRVDEMIGAGLAGEVKRLLADARVRASTAMQAIGYKEMAACLDGTCTLTQAAEEIKRGTRRYAKRQMTWFRRDDDVRWFDTDTSSFEIISRQIFDFIDKCGLL